MLKIPSAPKSENISDDYKVTVNGKKCFVEVCRVSALPFNLWSPSCKRPLDQTETASFVSFSGDEKIVVAVECRIKTDKAVVRPLSKNIKIKFDNNTAVFEIEKNGQYVFEVNDEHFALHIFYNAINEFPEKVSANYYFGKGVHEPGILEVKSGDSIYIDSEAVVYGGIYGNAVNNVRIFGYGILDDSKEERNGVDCYFPKPNGCIKFYGSSDIEIEGIILRDSAIWIVNLFDCDNVKIDNVKLVGHWRYNCDGIDVVNSSNVTIKNCFIRAFDDAIVLKGISYYRHHNVENITVENCVCWCGWGRTLEIGLETVAKYYKGIRFNNCDLIHNQGVCLDIQAGDFAKIDNVVFSDIRIEYQKNTLPEVAARSVEEKYPAVTKPYLPTLFGISNPYYDLKGLDCNKDLIAARLGKDFGGIRNTVFKDIKVYLEEGMPLPEIIFENYQNRGEIKNILIDNLSFNGKKIENISQLNLKVKGNVDNIIIK